jgi:hypothetical protein
MSKDKKLRFPSIVQHGWHVLPHVLVDAYNEELKDKDGFLGDRANKGAFQDILDHWRKNIAQNGADPFGDTPTWKLTKSQLDKYLESDDPLAAGLVHSAVEEFAGELAAVTARFLRLDEWNKTEHIVGGGLSGSHIGRLALGRALVLLKEQGLRIEMSTITSHPDEAGLLGGLELAPSWMLDGHDAIIATDIGGTNLRVGIVELKKKGDITRAGVWKSSLWRHKDDDSSRDDAIARMAAMISKLVKAAQEQKLKIAPFITVGCPRLHHTRRHHRERCAKPARRLGRARLQPVRRARPATAAHQRARTPVRNSQRRGRAGLERGRQHEGRRPLGRLHDWHRPRQRPVYEPEVGLQPVPAEPRPTEVGRVLLPRSFCPRLAFILMLHVQVVGVAKPIRDIVEELRRQR